MELKISTYHHCDLVEISGRIDSYSSPDIDSALIGLIRAAHYNIIVDLREVIFISSSGLLTFVKAQRELRQKNRGEVVFVNVPELVYTNFTIAGFNSIFNFFSDLETAKSWFDKTKNNITQTYPGNYKSLALIGQFIIEQSEKAGFSASDVYAIQTAVDEACSNIIDHAYCGEDCGDIQIVYSEYPDRIQIVITDQGEPFSPEDVPEPDITSPLEIRKERGLGIFFMRKLMDKVQFEFSTSSGNTLTLVKYKGE